MRRAWTWIIERWKITVPIALAGLALGIWLFFGFFGFHTLFFDETVNEAAPVFTTPTTTTAAPTTTATPTTTTTITTTSETGDTVATTTTTPPATTTVPPPATTEATAPAPITGSFIDRSHPTSGVAVVLGDGTTTFLRLEDFETDNGPDLNVYLSTADPNAPEGEFDDDFIDLGDLKGNIGSQNYEVPAGVDFDRYTTVVIWCVRFGVAFGAAGLSA